MSATEKYCKDNTLKEKTSSMSYKCLGIKVFGCIDKMAEVNIEMNVTGGSPDRAPFLNSELEEENERDVAQCPITMDVCEAQTYSKSYRTRKLKCTKYKFKYSNTAFGNGCVDLIRNHSPVNRNKRKYKISSSQELINLEVDREWDTIRHPYVLHYVNQKLLGSAGYHSLSIIASLIQFVLFALHLIYPNGITFWLVFSISLMSIGVLFPKLLLVTGTHWIYSSIKPWMSLLIYATNGTILLTLFFKNSMPMLPIFAITGNLLNLLYVLRKSPVGIYVLILTRIFQSFLYIISIWIPTLITFTFLFIEVMHGTDVEPWCLISENKTLFENSIHVYQSVVKTSTMMLGEVDVNDILKTKKWIPSSLALIFNVTAVILFMNLMISVAVGDVNDLKKEAEDVILKIKYRHVIEALQFPEYFSEQSSNGLVVFDDGTYILSDVDFETTPFDEMPITKKDSLWMRYSKWLIGLDMAAYLKNQPLPATRRRSSSGCYCCGRRADQHSQHRGELEN
ncbi:unnamed protein product [Caenorhabditis brenneri]